jgi:antitoxin component of RelBE/YafQ-DinJ toxin-antitoxin module
MTSPNPAFDNAWTMMAAVLQQWGLDSLSSVVRDMLTAGDSTDVIPLKLRQTEQYKARFSGNLLRQKAGLPALSESEYLGTEATYKSILRQYVGSGAYDSKDQLDKFFGSNVSPAELNNRMQEHQEFYQSKPQRVKDAWAAVGLTPADAIRTTLDPTVTETDLKRRLAAFSISAEAFNAYGDYQIDQPRLLDLADRGVSTTDAAKAFQEVAGRASEDKLIGSRSGIDLTRNDLENELLTGDAAAKQKRTSAYQQEDARFKQNYLGTQQGALGKDVQGRY